jgi:pimeloyl-ACP methyl ester carboxylesterase
LLSSSHLIYLALLRDGVKIHYSKAGTGKRMILLGNGLGCISVYWLPIQRYFAEHGLDKEYTSVTWDYRGLFRSTAPSSPARISIRDSAEDAKELLDHLGVEKADVYIGWSTGVQVISEL